MAALMRRRLAIGAAIASAILLKLWLLARLPLFGDEAFYWLESQHLAPAFDDVPAATPWLIALGTGLGGDSAFALRLPFLLLSLLTLYLLWRLARGYAESAGNWLLLSSLALPLLAANGLLALPDVPLNLACVLCLLALRLACDGQRTAPWWLALGLALGWLSHYRFVMPAAAAGLALLALPEGRELLRRGRLWIAALLGSALGLAPLLWQQWQSGGAGLWFQFGERHPWQFQWAPLADPLLQAMVSSPWLYLLLLLAGVSCLRWQPAGSLRLLAATGLAMLLLYWLLGPFADTERSRLHWPLPGYLALLVPLSVTAAESARRLRPALMLGGLWTATGALFLIVLAMAPQRLQRGSAYPANFSGWPDMAAEVRAQLRDLPADTVVVADNFMLAAQLQFALGARIRVYSLDHPLNHKHGRAGELRRMRRSVEFLPEPSPGQARLLVAELSASRLRERPAWFDALCEHFPRALAVGDVLIDHGRKRLLVWQDRGSVDTQCLPPALGYLDLPAAGVRIAPGARLSGWILRGGAGVQGARARIAEHLVPLRYGVPLPSLQDQLSSRDPNLPAVGFEGEWPQLSLRGRQWLLIEAQDVDGRWTPVLETAVELE